MYNQSIIYDRLIMFVIIFMICSAICLWSISASDMVYIMADQHGQLPVWGFIIVYASLSIFGAYMVYLSYKAENAIYLNDHSIPFGMKTIYAMIWYWLAQIFFTICLFHMDISDDVSGLALVLLVVATLWICWVCGRYSPWSLILSPYIIAFTIYFIIYYCLVLQVPWYYIDDDLPPILPDDIVPIY
jgi:hypothetical protein